MLLYINSNITLLFPLHQQEQQLYSKTKFVEQRGEHRAGHFEIDDSRNQKSGARGYQFP
jgi:hypothetical protein